jgi:hypothetical protein
VRPGGARWLGALALVALPVLPTGPSAQAYTEVAVVDGGAIAGVVRFTGKPVASGSAAVAARPDACGERRPPEVLVLGPDRGVAGGVVFVQGVRQGKRGHFDAVLDRRGCAFSPRIVATMAGARARVKNSDPVVHDARGLRGPMTVFHVAIPGKEQEVDITRRLTRPGVIRVVSDSAPHMAAWLIVHDSPYLAVTDDRGAFRIDDVPPGVYRVSVWHEGFRRRGVDPEGRPLYEMPHTITTQVTVAPRATTTVAFELR